MAGANWRPDTWFGLALNADPNDAYAVPVWSDFTDNFMGAQNYERGRDFELDQGMSSAPTLTIRDIDELLNPENPSSPYTGLIQPYRPAMLLAQWPRQADITGGAVNLFNVNAWHGNKEDTRDGSFESFTAGTLPSWASAVGPVNPLVSTLFPFQGTQSVRFPIGASASWQGMSWPVACIPGRQYTCSAYVLQDTASTQRISVTDQTLVADPFDGRTVANGVGTAYFGGTYTVAGGVAGNYAVANGTAQITNASVNVIREAVLSVGTPDVRVFGRFSVPVIPTGAAITSWVMGRRTDGNNMYIGQTQCNPDGTVSLALIKRVAGAQTTIGSTTLSALQMAGAEWNLLLECRRGLQFLYAWRTDKPGPVSEADALLIGTDTALSTGNDVGFMNRLETGSGDTNVVTSWSYFSATGYAHGGTTVTTGSYQRLSVTFTATRPVHTIQLATSGTALAATVNIDAIQHEQGAAASAYTTTGPAIYPVFRNALERYPRTYESAGFEAFVRPPCVDAMASLAAIAIESEYPQTVLNTGPDFYYRLNDGIDTGLFADSSGNGQPPLVRYISKYGAGTDIEPGTALAIAGDQSATGVQFTAVNSGGLGNRPGTALALATPTTFPPAVSSAGAWAITFACWVQLTANPTGDYQTLIDISAGPPFMSVAPLPLLIRVQATQVDLNFSSLIFSTSSIIGSGTPHHIVGTVSAATPATTNLALWVDGVKVSGSIAGSFLTSTPARSLVIGARNDQLPFGYAVNGTISHASLWNRALTDGEVATLYSAGSIGFNGETTGVRVDRHLDLGGYNGSRRISSNAGQTTLQAPSWTGQKDLLSDSQENTTAEQGTFWAAPDGAVVFESRQDRWLRLTSNLIIGEDAAAGEVPYLMDGLKMDFDAMYVFANVQVGRLNGTTAVGGNAQDIAIARRRYFPRSAGGSFDFATDDLAQSMANWIFNTHDAPMMRIAAIEIDPVGNPALWPLVLALEIGRRVTFRRRSKAANGGAGIIISRDFFIEKVAIPTIDMEACVWRYKVQLSPINAGAAAQGQPTMQPWILGDATYSVLGQTTVLGW